MAKILIVDDDYDIVEILSMALRRKEHEVLTALNGPDALRLAEETQPDLILLDLMMPDMDGSEVYQKLRNGKKTAAIPIIAISSSIDRLNEARDIMDGAFDTMLKTDGINNLLDRINPFLLANLVGDQSSKGDSGDKD